MGTDELSRNPDNMLGGNLRWTSIPSGGSSNTPSRFMLRKRDKLRWCGPLACLQTLPFLSVKVVKTFVPIHEPT